MKKHVLFSAAMVAAMTASAQTGEITSNRGENWLSQSGDWGLTFEATPLINFAGNLFNGNTNNGGVGLNNFFSSTSSSGSQVVIGGKKLIDANTAYRGRVRIGFGSSKETSLVDVAPLPNPLPTFPNPIPQVEDVMKSNYMAVQLGAGIEKRVGSTRVVGVYGGELNIGLGSSKTTYEYGNALSNDNQGSRPTEMKDGSVFSIGLNGFAGVEWFAAPKISLSGEYTWGLAMMSEGFGETTTEHWVPSTTTPNTGSVQSVTVEGGPYDTKNNSFGIDTGVSGARIGINFYFQ
ncbi:MAG: hypothetical protein KDB95_08675 [Flavobacteriales bacterium]|nr:hypothetical protein [Flavobacteriales bacterium]